MRVRATGVASLGTAGDGDGAAAGVLEGDGALDGSGAHAVEGCAGRGVSVAAAAA